MPKDLIDLASLGAAGIERILERARELRQLPRAERERLCAGRELVHLFLEPSTRTRISFELAARRVGARVIDFDGDASSLRKGESLSDTIRTIEAMEVDGFVLRHGEDDMPRQVAEVAAGAVINAGAGTTAHPTQGLLDRLTLEEELGDLAGRRIAIVGDVRHSRVAASDVVALSLAGAQVHLVAPPELQRESVPDGVERGAELDPLLPERDAIVMLRIQRERIREEVSLDLDGFVERYQLHAERLGRMPDGAVVLHPGPMNRGIEISDAVADGPRSRILDQVRHGVEVRAAVLEHCLDGPR
jgi:aspartate carbamoyltransferase catalytic subunit